MECKFCGSEIEDTEIQCPVCKQSLVEVKTKIKVRCLISNYETEIDENDNEFYCEKCFSNHIIDGEDFIKVSKTQENENLNKTPLEKEIKEEAIYLILKNNENEHNYDRRRIQQRNWWKCWKTRRLWCKDI